MTILIMNCVTKLSRGSYLTFLTAFWHLPAKKMSLGSPLKVGHHSNSVYKIYMMQVFLPHFVEIDTKSKSQLSW
jgi:hypothetical protein